MDLEQAQLALSDANGRIVELAEQVRLLAGERDALTTERDSLLGERQLLTGRAAELEMAQTALTERLVGTAGTHATVTNDLEEARQALSLANGRGLTYLRRALLAEQAGQVVPELVTGDDEETLLASVDVAQQAYGRALEVARVTIAQQTVPAGAPSARTVAAEGLSPLAMIESGLRR